VITNEIINRIIGIKESYELPQKLLAKLLNQDERELMFNEFLKYENNLSFDWFTNYFQQEQGDRNSLKQDFTPKCLCYIVSKIAGQRATYTDVCSGIGGLTIGTLQENPDAFIRCEEISSRAIPMLIFNLAIRNVNGVVIHGDCLCNEVERIYKLTKGEKFSKIDVLIDDDETKTECVISNPPYSLKWDRVEEFSNDERFTKYGLPPKSKADYGFILHGLNKLQENGKMIAILPHGVLFRGSKEGEIRKRLVEHNKISAVIGLPDKLFLNTSIPVCLLIFSQNKENSDILFIDASKDFENIGKQNDMTIAQIDKLISVYNLRLEVKKYSHIATINEIRENDYNLNIPRYVDTYEKPEKVDIIATMNEIKQLDKEIQHINGELSSMLKDMCSSNEKTESELKYAQITFDEMLRIREEQK